MQIKLATVAAAILLSSSALAASVPSPALYDRALSKPSVIKAIEAEISKLTPVIIADRDAIIKVLSDPKATKSQIDAVLSQLNKDIEAAEPEVEKLLKEAKKVGLTAKDLAAILKYAQPDIKQIFELPGVTVKVTRGVTLSSAEIEKEIAAAIKQLTPIITADEAALVKLLKAPNATAAAIAKAYKKLEADLEAAAPKFEALFKEALKVGLTKLDIEKLFKDVAPEIKKFLESLPGLKVTISTRGAPALTKAGVIAAIEKAIKAAIKTLTADKEALIAVLKDPKHTAAQVEAAYAQIKKDLAALLPKAKTLVEEAKKVGLTLTDLEKILKDLGADDALTKSFVQYY
ncbi:hypothetical protein OC846_004309 [Tilletia horrida]|uniref:Uncharacterized protein n=1 Tax=Tilletia horrida TaxID=155126 RepID=A0AAN6GNK5_9BASI|nr:hypothetical protein OC846_004309 [Tilletia horrida]KAK0552299.1 hypothetical protein OC845_001779 [Tilletia horrida]KAK0568472.1 hypothetical protein OC861_001877 [Tilletia horrida]